MAAQQAHAFGLYVEASDDHRNDMRASNPSVILNRGGKQDYIGALPPGPAPPEGDWFTRLLERWKEIQQRIEKLQAEDAAGGRTDSSDSAKAAASAFKSTPQSKKELAAPIGTADSDGVQ